jgi:hypothetical protein
MSFVTSKDAILILLENGIVAFIAYDLKGAERTILSKAVDIGARSEIKIQGIQESGSIPIKNRTCYKTCYSVANLDRRPATTKSVKETRSIRLDGRPVRTRTADLYRVKAA